MFVASSYKQHLLTLHAEIACIYIRRDVDAGQVADVHRPVGVGQGGSDKRALEIFHIVCM